MLRIQCYAIVDSGYGVFIVYKYQPTGPIALAPGFPDMFHRAWQARGLNLDGNAFDSRLDLPFAMRTSARTRLQHLLYETPFLRDL